MKVAVAVALQRYRETPPVAREQRDLARLYAQRHSASLHIVTSGAPIELVRDAAQTLDAKLDRYVWPLREEGFNVETHTLTGRPADILPAWLEIQEVDLLILGTHAKRIPADVPIGQNAAELLAEVKCKVLLVRPKQETWGETRSLMDNSMPWELSYS